MNEEKPKRNYKKRKTDKVISVTYYLNKRLKSKIIDDKVCFPLYISINYDGQTTNVKSRLDKYIAEDDLDQFEIDFSEELKKEKTTIKESIRRRSERKEQANAQYFLQGLKSLHKSIYQSLKLETQFIIALKDDEAVEWLQNANGHDLSTYQYMVSLTTVSHKVRLINWDEFELFNTIELLLDLMPYDVELRSLFDSLNREISFSNVYEEIAAKYFDSSPKVEDWRTGGFQQSIRDHFNSTEYSSICNDYIQIIDSLLTKQERLS